MPAAKPDRPAPMMIVSYMDQSTKSQASNHKQILSTKSQRRKQLPVTVSLHFTIGVLDLFDAWCLRFGALRGIPLSGSSLFDHVLHPRLQIRYGAGQAGAVRVVVLGHLNAAPLAV